MSDRENAAEAPRRVGLPSLGLKRKAFTVPFANKALNTPPAPQQPKPSPLTAHSHDDKDEDVFYFTILYTKYNQSKLRKNKKFEDGVLEMRVGGSATLYDVTGKTVAKSALRGYDPGSMGEGSSVLLGSWSIEVEARMPTAEFRSGAAFLGGTAATVAATRLGPAAELRPAATAVKAAFKPLVASADRQRQTPAQHPVLWTHDPHAPGAIVLNREEWEADPSVAPVVVDPHVGRHLRPHQVEGVRFLYTCCVGTGPRGEPRPAAERGAILADAMGLGKTLQVIALLWTLLRQGTQGRPMLRRALIVAPTTLVGNWASEVKRWLGSERIDPVVLGPGAGQEDVVRGWAHGAARPLMLASYDLARRHAAAMAGAAGLLVCDEGHRLKAAAGNKTISALCALRCPARVLLTGTPVQNVPQEFFAMADFVRPGVLGELATFERVFGGPIARAQDRACSPQERELGEDRSRELLARVASFMLRRTSDVIAKFLPPLSVYVVFCRPSEAQVQGYRELLGSAGVTSIFRGGGGSAGVGDQALAMLSMLRKLCNHPCLLEEGGRLDCEGQDISLSGKLATADAILSAALADSSERAVVVSQSTATLDLLGALCTLRGWPTARLDGGTDAARRADIVSAFNSHGVGRVFLLSTTAGGAGLNLTGAARLLLFDSHWNPAMDQQAMARIWRDGQKKACTVYRLLTTGTLDEKMYQRQRMKGDMAAGLESGNPLGSAGQQGPKAGPQFSREELRRLFTLTTSTDCETCDLLQASGKRYDNCLVDCEDDPLRAAAAAGLLTFVHLESRQNCAGE